MLCSYHIISLRSFPHRILIRNKLDLSGVDDGLVDFPVVGHTICTFGETTRRLINEHDQDVWSQRK
jgi:hypothetical protein